MIQTIKTMQQIISEECENIKTLLLRKNESYGNSAAEPINIFSKAPAIDQINVRIDDKLKRLRDGKEFENEDTEQDLIGYLILKRCVKKSPAHRHGTHTRLAATPLTAVQPVGRLHAYRVQMEPWLNNKERLTCSSR